MIRPLSQTGLMVESEGVLIGLLALIFAVSVTITTVAIWLMQKFIEELPFDTPTTDDDDEPTTYK